MEKYNGWTNYATWRINLELFDGYVLEDCVSYDPETDDRDDTIDNVAQILEDRADEAITNYGELKDCIAVDYARSFISGVNWHEIAEHLVDEYVA